MRCPHCAGEIPAGARFCGICGRSIPPLVEGRSPVAPAERRPPQPVRPSVELEAGSVSLFELPASRSGRRARMALVLMLDAILAGAGVVMMLSYLDSRREARKAAPAGLPASEPGGKVEVLSPTGAATPRAPAPAAAEETTRRESGAPARPEAAGSKAEPAPPPAPRLKAKPAARPRPRSAPGIRSEAGVGMEQGADEVAGDASLWQELDRGADVSAAALGQPVASVDSEAETERRIARLRRVVDSHQAELERCYTEASAGGAGQSLQGRIDIRFTLMSDGRTAGVSSSRNTTGSGQLADCVAGLVRAWRFPAREDPLELEWPFLFHPAAD